MKKLLSTLLAAVLLLLTPVSALAANPHKVMVTAEKTAVHESASAESDKLATVRKGYTFTPIGSTKSFWKMEFKLDNDNAIHTGYILKADTAIVEAVHEPSRGAGQNTNKTPSKSSGSYTGNTSSTQSLSVVCWTVNGDVYHSSSNCRSLARSKNIRSGTIAQSGKHRGCNNCVR